MFFLSKRTLYRWLIVLSSFTLIGLFLWNTSVFFNELKKEEQKKMEIWVDAQTQLIQNDNPENEVNPILLSIIQKNTSTPMILHSTKGDVYEAKNISDKKELNQEELKSLAQSYKLENSPINIYNHNKLYGTVYYGNSSFIDKIKYYPLLIIGIVFLFIIILYYFYAISKSNEQNRLWAGMARETAHQIGTPLSSLVGWTEILKSENVNPEYIVEMEKDADRLKTITERFSKIGSVPRLKNKDLVKTVTETFEYLERRSSKLIEFELEKPQNEIQVKLNTQLLGWTIENLVKNAIDATRGKGKIKLRIFEDSKWAYLHISDTGKGLSKKNFKAIFKPGNTSKKRGWGLGLSLSKRIIQEYHQGKIKVLKSEIGKGATFEIRLRKV